jgi:integrase
MSMAHKKGKRRRAAEELMEELGESSEGKRAPTLEDVRTILGKAGELARAEALVSGGKRIGWREFEALLHTVIFTGGRISEMLGLAWPRVRIGVSKIYIVQRADARGRLGSPKSEAGSRSITIPQHLCDLLEAWRPHCPEGPHKLVFPNGVGNVESQSNLRDRFWIPLLERCELMVRLPDGKHVTPFGFHGFRALRNSVMKAIGVSIENRMDEHGWSSEDMPEKVYELDLADPEILVIRQRSASALAAVMLGKGAREGNAQVEAVNGGAHIKPT